MRYLKHFVLAAALAFLSVASASAADLMPRKAAPVAVAVASAAEAVNGWSGLYLGAHAGYNAADASVLDTNGGVAPGPFGYSPSGAFGGGQIGYNLVFSNILIGVEGQVAYASTNGRGIIGSANAAAHQDLTLDNGVLGDVTGRVGVTFGQFLVYGKGGAAWFNGSAKQTTTNPGYVTTGTDTFNGWTVGGGVEYMLSKGWSLKAEYQHYDFGSKGGYQTNVGDLSSPIGYQFTNETSLKFNTVKAGVNYHF